LDYPVSPVRESALEVSERTVSKLSAPSPTEEEIKKRNVHVRYMSDIDTVFKKQKTQTNADLTRLAEHVRKEPARFEHDYMNLNSYIEDLEAVEEERRAKASFALEQIPQQAELAQRRKDELDRLKEKFQIKTNPDQEIFFKQLIEMKCSQPKFFY